MPYTTKYGKLRYTDYERALYHAKKSRVGAKRKDGTPVSDYARGKHSGIATTLIRKGKYENYKWKKQKGIPTK